MLRQLLAIVMKLIAAGIPLPQFTEKTQVIAWLQNNVDGLADLIVLVATQVKGPVVLEAGAEHDEAIAMAAAEAGVDVATIWKWIQTVLAIIEMLRK